MRAFIKSPIVAKDLKVELKNFGVKVLRCAKDKDGVSIVIKDETKNELLFVDFCKKNGLKSRPDVNKMGVITSIKGDFLQYPTVYKFKEI